MAKRKRGRDIDGVVLLDKPVGGSSNAALQRVRRAFDARKAGHTGSLDPLASGLLAVCLGEATKLSSYLLHADKVYRVAATVGSETETGDREGAVTRRSATEMPDRATLEATLARFVGPQQQIPPMYSALKQQGKRLYELARAGRVVERPARAIHVHALTLIDVGAHGFTFEASVSSGTYIRSLVADIARHWGGLAHVGGLRRLRVGGLGQAIPMTPLAEIEARAARGADLSALLLPVSTVTEGWPQIMLSPTALDAIQHGRAVSVGDLAPTQTRPLRLTAADGRFFGLGRVDTQGRLAAKRLFVRPQH